MILSEDVTVCDADLQLLALAVDVVVVPCHRQTVHVHAAVSGLQGAREVKGLAEVGGHLLSMEGGLTHALGLTGGILQLKMKTDGLPI